MKDNELDARIKKALQSNTMDFDDEKSVARDVMDTFKGKYRWFMIYNWARVFLVAVFMFLFIYQFFQQQETQLMIAYATGVVVCVVAMSSIALFFWHSVNKNVVVREVKRLELQIALLVKQLEAKS